MRGGIEGGGWWGLVVLAILLVGIAAVWRTARTRSFPIPYLIWVVTGFLAGTCFLAPIEVCATSCSSVEWLSLKLALWGDLVVPFGLWCIAGAVIVAIRRGFAATWLRPT